jgi:glycyl-tRNA synthetase beta chain
MTQNTTNGLSFLLEVGTEDLPARFLTPALQQLRDNTGKILRDNHIQFSDVRIFGTPRRLTTVADGVHPMQEDTTREVFGPSKKAAFDEDGRPTKAAIGFARSQRVSVESLVIKNKDKGEYVVALIDEKGSHVREILPDICRKIVFSIHLPKSMRWGDNTIRFVRPIRWLMALFDKEVIEFEIDGIKSSNLTRGHRFLSPASFQLMEIPGYRRLLANNFVIVDQEERKKIIVSKMESLLAPSGEMPVKDEELLETVTNLVEYPVPVLATFSKEYLELPKELLITVMKGHQKYFAVEDAGGGITNRFVVISNTSEENADVVKIGAERVIKARFEDARFYFEEDRKRPLSARLEDLRKVTFQESLGSLYEKTERVATIAGLLADELLPSEKDRLVRAARLSKADLITGVVREFPELQGTMGKYYAGLDGEDREVAEAIEEQYLPAHSGGRLPQTDLGALLALAEKGDNITAFFAIGLTPTGSEDPFALRRQSLGIIAILFDKGYSLTLRGLVSKALHTLSYVKDPEETEKKILQFFEGRLEMVFSDYGYSPDLIGAVLSLTSRVELRQISERLDALRKFKGEDRFNDFLTAVKRVCNIIPGTAIPGLRRDLLTEEPEKNLKEEFDSAARELSVLLGQRKYYEALKLLSSLTVPINNFFDRTLVMDKREEIKLNRLALLKEIWSALSEIADFSKISAVQES